MTLTKEPFRRYYLEEEQLPRKQITASVWLNKEGQQKYYELASRLRMSQQSTIFNAALDLALEHLRGNEKIEELLYAQGRKASRKGLDELDLIQKELKKFLGETISEN